MFVTPPLDEESPFSDAVGRLKRVLKQLRTDGYCEGWNDALSYVRGRLNHIEDSKDAVRDVLDALEYRAGE